MRARAAQIMKTWGSPNHPYPVEEFIGYMADNMTVCSNYCCGNPRRHFKELTVQERKQEAGISDEIDH